MEEIKKEEVVKSEEELAQEALILKKESLKEFSRVKEDDPEVIEEVKEVLTDEKVAHLKQVILDDQAEIDRRTAHKAEAEAELAKYLK